VTSTVRISGAELASLPGQDRPAGPKGKMFDIMTSINEVRLVAPVHIGDVVIKNVCSTGVDVVVTRNMEKI
jgi:CxxC motif-containing protein